MLRLVLALAYNFRGLLIQLQHANDSYGLP